MKRYLLDEDRAVTGLCLGALCGAGLVATAFTIWMTADALSQGRVEGAPAALLSSATPLFILSLLIALIAYALGLAIVGVPSWAALHACRARSWQAAVLLGAALNGGAVLLLGVSMLTPTPATLLELSRYVAFFAANGAVVGWVIWRTAYRKGPDIEALS